MNERKKWYWLNDPFHLTASQITKDNPSFSMVNDSDEDIIYGSDEDEDTKTPLNFHAHSHSTTNHHDDSD